MLHPETPAPPILMPNDKPVLGSVPINNNFTPQPVQPPQVRPDFPAMPQPLMHPTPPQAPVFTGNLALCFEHNKML